LMERSYNKYAILSSNINYLLNYFLEKLLCNYRTTQGFFNSPTDTLFVRRFEGRCAGKIRIRPLLHQESLTTP
jgi:hypothetical protein